jgi:DNA polymerase-3 subunit gamma/tau
VPQKPAPSEAGAASPVGFDELQGVWREVLEELLEGDREAWNAVKAVQPLSLDGEVLAVGVASRSDLEAFKVSGAGPLREALEAALGITVKYVPRQIPAAQAAPREPQPTDASDEEPSPQAEPAQAPLARREPGYSEPELSEPPAAAWAEPENRRPEPEEAAPAPAVTEQSGPARGEFGDPGFTPDRDPYEDPAYSDDLGELDDAYAGTAPNPEPVTRDPESTAPETETESESEPETETEPEPELRASDSEPQVPDSGPQASEPEPEASEPAQSGVQAPARQSAPSFSRYGEAVIREVLGARFIEERPLPQEER